MKPGLDLLVILYISFYNKFCLNFKHRLNPSVDETVSKWSPAKAVMLIIVIL